MYSSTSKKTFDSGACIVQLDIGFTGTYSQFGTQPLEGKVLNIHHWVGTEH